MTVAVRVIPCLDVDGGRVVKGVNFRQLRDAGDPVELAARYDTEGADELTFLDVTASAGGRDTMVDVVRRTAEQVFIPLTVGGGVRSVEDMGTLLSAGADKTAVNSASRQTPVRLPGSVAWCSAFRSASPRWGVPRRAWIRMSSPKVRRTARPPSTAPISCTAISSNVLAPSKRLKT